jgi:hypothetical protein
MLANAPSFASIPAKDIGRAKRWYEERSWAVGAFARQAAATQPESSGDRPARRDPRLRPIRARAPEWRHHAGSGGRHRERGE